MKHCGLSPLMQSEVGACDQENFVEICNFLKNKDADLINLWYFISQLWALLWMRPFCIVFYGSPSHMNDTHSSITSTSFTAAEKNTSRFTFHSVYMVIYS